MSLILISISFTLTILLAIFSLQIGEAASLRARAQIAADGAALAAASEAFVHRGGSRLEQARRFAEMNGARLLGCDCTAASSRVQVEVAVGDVVARARAEADAELLGPAEVATPDDLHPTLADAVEELTSAAPGRITLVSGFRSTSRQSELWTRALARYGGPESADDWVARPGGSMHEKGLAVDLGGDVELAARLAVELGLPIHRPLPNEPWHFELIGSRG